MVDLAGAYRPEVERRVGYLDGDTELLRDILTEKRGSGGALDAVVVPFTAGPRRSAQQEVDAAVAASGARVRVTEPLGPHPMLAEVLHMRLAEAGFVRADRMRLISVVAASAQMADGVIVGSVGGGEGLEAAGVAAVLLAARLGVTVLPAAVDDPVHLAQTVERLRGSGSVRPVLAPCLLGHEVDLSVVDRLAADNQIRRCGDLGSHSTLAKIVALRYAEVLNSLEAEGPQSLDELPAPTGTRHRRDS